MKVGDAIAEIMKREGVEILCGYPVNHLLEYAAKADIRPIIVRQERIGLHMADAISRVTSGHKVGAFCMQHGPGTENAYGGVAQAFSESVPLLVIRRAIRAASPGSIPTTAPCARCAGWRNRPNGRSCRPRCRTPCAAPSRA